MPWLWRGGFAGRADAMTARQALRLATRGGAEVLGRFDQQAGLLQGGQAGGGLGDDRAAGLLGLLLHSNQLDDRAILQAVLDGIVA